jgi:hypothetical protein
LGNGFRLDAENGNRDIALPGKDPNDGCPLGLAGCQVGRLQRPGQWQFGVDERGKGRFNLLDCQPCQVHI